MHNCPVPCFSCGVYFILGDTKDWIEIHIFPTGEYSIISKNDVQEYGVLEFGKWTYIKGKVLFQKLRSRNNNYLAVLRDSLGGYGTLNILVGDDRDRELSILASDNYLNAHKNDDSNMKYLLKRFSYRDWPEILKIHKPKD